MAEGQVIFDTDVLVWALRGNLKAAHAINNVPHRALSIVSLMELLQGARSKMEARQIQQFLRQPAVQNPTSFGANRRCGHGSDRSVCVNTRDATCRRTDRGGRTGVG